MTLFQRCGRGSHAPSCAPPTLATSWEECASTRLNVSGNVSFFKPRERSTPRFRLEQKTSDKRDEPPPEPPPLPPAASGCPSTLRPVSDHSAPTCPELLSRTTTPTRTRYDGALTFRNFGVSSGILRTEKFPRTTTSTLGAFHRLSSVKTPRCLVSFNKVSRDISFLRLKPQP